MRNPRRDFLRVGGLNIAGFLFGGCSTTAIEPLFAPKAELWSIWARHAARSTHAIDHGDWDRLLDRHVVRGNDGINRLSYARFSLDDRRVLDAYVARLAGIPILDHARNEQLAYWINLYNALTVKVVLAHYPVRSIRDIDLSSGVFSDGPWDRKLIRIGSHPISLNDIEHRILRPIWLDPRIHYAVNCAAIGCPNLPIRAFTAANADQMMTRAAVDYVNHPRGVRIIENGLVISKIYLWYAQDFGRDHNDITKHILHYARPELAARISRNATIVDYEYDWSINDVS